MIYQHPIINESKESIKLSVILPIYSGQDTIGKCINSIAKQNFEQFELILLDDGSKDKSIEISKCLLSKFSVPYEIIIHDENQGIAQTLNEGIKKAKGRYILIIHQDCELVNNNYFYDAIETLKKNPNATALCGKPLYPVWEFGFWEKIFMIHSGHSNKKSSTKIEEISFSEHKCDLFEAKNLLQNEGFDQGNFKFSGEDQMKSYQLKSLGFSLLRNNNLIFIQRYGRTVASFEGLFKKIFKYGLFQSKVILLTRGKIFGKNNRTKDLNLRIKNRVLGIFIVLLFISFGLLLLGTQNFIFLVPMVLLSIFRSFYLILQKKRTELKMGTITLFFSGLVTFLADIFYLTGLLVGIIMLIGSILSKILFYNN